MTAPDFVALHYLAEDAAWHPDRYYRYDLMTQLMEGWVREYPELIELSSIGASGEGRAIWVAIVTNRATGSDRDKPAYYVDGNIHAGEVMTSSVALGTIHHVLSRYGTDAEITRLLDETVLYVVPRIAVDGSERYLTSTDDLRSTTAPYAPNTGGGLKRADLNGDGLISTMRFKDPAGPWKRSSIDPRVMVKRDPHEFGGDYYFVLPEGTIDPWDGGKIAIAPTEWALDFNRNFPNAWRPEWQQRGAGPYPLSQPEPRAIADFVLDHPNIVGSQHYHTAAGIILRGSGLYGDDQMPPLDLRAYKALGEMGERATGYRCISIYHDNPFKKDSASYGMFFDFMFDQAGVFMFATELWRMAQELESSEVSIADSLFNRPESNDAEFLKLFEVRAGGRGFTEWTPFDHPQFGAVEIGGWEDKFGVMNPPGPMLPEHIDRNIPFTIAAMGASPRLRVVDSGATALGNDLYEVWVIVSNDGFLPSYGSETYKATGKAKEITAKLSLPDGARLVPPSSPAEQSMGHLAGRVSQFTSFLPTGEYPVLGRARAAWVVQTAEPIEVSLAAGSNRAGQVTTVVQIGE
jgi:murein tripeptide amidase MpaA